MKTKTEMGMVATVKRVVAEAGVIRVLNLIVSILLLIVGFTMALLIDLGLDQIKANTESSNKHSISISTLFEKDIWHSNSISINSTKINKLEDCTQKTREEILILKAKRGVLK